MAKCGHEIREATSSERKEDCCGDRYESTVAYVCACGVKACRACMEGHLMETHGGHK